KRDGGGRLQLRGWQGRESGGSVRPKIWTPDVSIALIRHPDVEDAAELGPAGQQRIVDGALDAQGRPHLAASLLRWEPAPLEPREVEDDDVGRLPLRAVPRDLDGAPACAGVRHAAPRVLVDEDAHRTITHGR